MKNARTKNKIIVGIFVAFFFLCISSISSFADDFAVCGGGSVCTGGCGCLGDCQCFPSNCGCGCVYNNDVMGWATSCPMGD